MRIQTGLMILLLSTWTAAAAPPLHEQIDRMIEHAAGGPMAPRTPDAAFLRRVTLDLNGTIPTADDVRRFEADTDADKRAKAIDRLLDSPRYADRMRDLFHSMLMERRGDHDGWLAYLHESFAENKPWDRMAREILHPDARNPKTRHAAFFYTKRLEKVGEQPIDYPGLTRDVARLFMGRDLQCAQCHKHLFIDDYKQKDFQGLFAFYQNIKLFDAKEPAIEEKVMTEKLEFVSVFTLRKDQVGPRLPAGDEMKISVFDKKEALRHKADKKKKLPAVPKYSPLEQLAGHLTDDAYQPFAQNITNRLWFAMMGRGLVHPLDLHHSGNPASHPKLLETLAEAFVAQQYDIKAFLRELALSETYQRSTRWEGQGDPPPADRYRLGLERGLLAEQMLASLLQATGETARYPTDSKGWQDLRKRFVRAVGNVAKEPEIEFSPSLKAALFLMNDSKVLQLFEARDGNLVDRLAQEKNIGRLAEQLYLSVLSRRPTDEERDEVEAWLAQADDRSQALGHFAWALAASSEFCLNH